MSSVEESHLRKTFRFAVWSKKSPSRALLGQSRVTGILPVLKLGPAQAKKETFFPPLPDYTLPTTEKEE